MSTGRHRRGDRRTWWRRGSSALLAAGVLCLSGAAAGIVTADASPASPGSGFGNVDITVTATGMRTPFFSHSGEDVESEVPYASATLTSGGTGHALTSIFWPGGTGGHGGDTLKLLAGGCVPPNPGNTVPIPIPVPLPPLPCLAHSPTLPDPVYENLNDNYRAEVQSSSDKNTVTKTGPGVNMKATATAALTAAATEVAGAKLPSGANKVGTTSTSTSIHLTGPRTAVVDAVSVVRDISLGGGALTIHSVQSIAHGVTDGKTASGHATTVVNGMKIGGVPVTVDNKGVHIKGNGQKLPSLDALNSALKKAGFQVFVADPTKQIHGATANLYSGQLVIMQDNSQYTSNANDSATVLSFGGAGLNADASPGYVYKGGVTPVPPASNPPAAQPGGATVNPPAAPATGGGSVPAPQVGDAPPDQQAPILAAARSHLPGGIAPAWVVLALLGAGLIAFGLKRLPDQVLAAGGPACTLGE